MENCPKYSRLQKISKFLHDLEEMIHLGHFLIHPATELDPLKLTKRRNFRFKN
jgi:hypothetical protein